MTKIRTELESIRKERALRRDYRHERGFYAVSLAGYANAGKSSLFQALSGEEVLVDDRLFTTLSTTTRTLRGVRRKILLTDTVGFVSDVPLWLVQAFRSTFEEVFASDLVLLLLDVSDPFDMFQKKVDLAATTLLTGMEPDRVQPILAKCDLVSGDAVERRAAAVQPFPRTPLAVSVRTGEGMEALRDLIIGEFRYPVSLKVELPQDDRTGAFLAWLYRKTEVLEITYPGQKVLIELRCRERDVSRIEAEARAAGASSSVT
jgi:GTP-binding protein HflX